MVQDKQLRGVARDMLMYAFIVAMSGYVTRKLVDKYISPEATQMAD